MSDSFGPGRTTAQGSPPGAPPGRADGAPPRPAGPEAGVHVFVRGVPAPKGSKRAFVKNGRAVVVDDAKKTLRDWENAVRFVLQSAWAGPPIEGPVAVTIRFVLLRPKSVSKKRMYPTVKPDVDKLARAILDPMSSVVFRDDAQVVDLVVAKEYGEETGAYIDVQNMKGVTA